MDIIWTYAPLHMLPRGASPELYGYDRNDPRNENWHVKWICVEENNGEYYIDGVRDPNFENKERLFRDLSPSKIGKIYHTKIAIFENEEDKVKFILRWL